MKSDFDFEKTLRSIEANTASVRRMGSAVLDLCYVAAGRFESYIAQTLSPWDMAAASLIVSEAGGTVTDLNGTNKFMDTAHILAGSENMHKTMMKHIC